jgi:2-methylcitrate dehydratase PrpD
MAGGLFAYLGDGSATKPIHAGWAAGSGLTAALLAAAGGEGPREVFEDRFGFFAAYYRGNAADPTTQVESLGHTWETPRIAFKAYPACHFVHGCLDAAATARNATGWNAEDIETITVAVAEPGIPLVLEPREAKARPRSDYDAKFSVPYSVAAMLVHGHVDLGSYADDALDDHLVLDVAARVEYEHRAFATFPRAFPGWVRLAHRDGHTFEAEAPYQRGAPEHPLSEAEVREKFRRNAALALEPDAVTELEETLLALDELNDVRDATRIFAVEHTQVPTA